MRTFHSSPEVKYDAEIQHLSGVAGDWLQYLREILAQTFSSCNNIRDPLQSSRYISIFNIKINLITSLSNSEDNHRLVM